jgi:hypothetical protein
VPAAEHVKTDRQTLRRSARRLPARGETGSLFESMRESVREAAQHASAPQRRRSVPELIAARVLCHQLKRKRVSAEKRRLVHLICLNLLSILRRGSQPT